MSLRSRIADYLLSAATPTERPTPGELAGYGRESVTEFGSTTARIGRFNPDTIGNSTYDAMERDGQVGAGLDLVALAATSAGWSVEGPDDVVSAYVAAALEPHYSRIMRNCAWTGYGRGCAPHEVVWERRDTTVELPDGGERVVSGWVPAKVKDLAPDGLTSILVDGYEEFAGYRVNTPSVIDVPAAKCFHYAHNMRYGNYWGEGKLRRAYEPWYRFQMLWDQSVRYMERMATPPVLVRFAPGTTDGTTHAATAAAIGAALTTSDMYATVPDAEQGMPRWDVEFKTDDKRSDMFIQMLNAHNAWKLRALLVPDTMFTQQANTGSLALSQTHFDVFLMAIEGLVAEVFAAINDQLVPRITAYTFGADVPAPHLVTPGLTDDTKAALYDLFAEAVRTSQASVDWDAIGDRLDIPTLAEDSATAPEELPESDEKASPEEPDAPEPDDEDADEELTLRPSLARLAAEIQTLRLRG